jgi:hypothetical protein
VLRTSESTDNRTPMRFMTDTPPVCATRTPSSAAGSRGHGAEPRQTIIRVAGRLERLIRVRRFQVLIARFPRVKCTIVLHENVDASEITDH